MAGKSQDILTGTRFGRLTVTGPAIRRKERYLYVPVLCECGRVREIERNNLLKGFSKSCGCWNAEVVRDRSRTHGQSQEPIYAIWNVMIQRCHSKANRQYLDYGGRGITVSEAWHTFENFFADMGHPPFKGATLERRHNDQGYNKENCLWATRTEQTRNRRNSKWVEYRGQQVLFSDMLEMLGRFHERGKIYQRMHTYGWTFEKAVSTP